MCEQAWGTGEMNPQIKEEKKCSWSLCYIFYLQCQVPSLPTISTVQIQTGALRPPHSVSSLKFSLTAIPVQISVGICP